MENLNRALPELHQKIAEVQDLSKRVPPAGNMTESMWRIKDVIEETRNYVTTVRSIFRWSVSKTKGLFLISLGRNKKTTVKKRLPLDSLPDPLTAVFSHHLQRHEPRGASPSQRPGRPESLHGSGSGPR